MDEFRLSILRSHPTQGDDQRLLTFQCVDECLRVAVIDLLGHHALWNLALTICSGDCCDCVLSGSQEGVSNELADIATSLLSSADDEQTKAKAITYANDSNVVDVV